MTPYDQKFIVYCLRFNENPSDGGEPTVEYEVVGIFNNYDDALVSRDIHADLDTTSEAVSIMSAAEYTQAPDYDVMWKMSVSPDGETITIDSMCVLADTEPWLAEDRNRCEALVIPEDGDSMVEYMMQWCAVNRRTTPSVIDQRSPSAQEMVEGL